MNGSDGNFWAIMIIVRKGDKYTYIHYTHIYIYIIIYIHISMVLGALFSYEPT